MRPTWTGAITFGLVNIPVQLHPAIRSSERVSFRMLHKDDLSPIRYERVCQKEGEAVPWSEIVKGYEYEKGKYVVLTDDDFKAAAIESSKQIEILDFVSVDEIDPRFFETPYYLVPGKGGDRAYALLREAIRQTNTVGIGKVTMRSNSHHLVGIRVVGDALVLEIMRFADELVPVESLNFPAADAVRPQELQMAEQLVANLTDAFDPAKYADDYRANLMRIIRAKMKGKKITIVEPEEPASTPVVDLMTRLQESLAQGTKARRSHTGDGAPARTTRRRTGKSRKSA